MEKGVTAEADKPPKVARKRISSRILTIGRYPSQVQRGHTDNVVSNLRGFKSHPANSPRGQGKLQPSSGEFRFADMVLNDLLP